MARIFIEGFEHAHLKHWDYLNDYSREAGSIVSSSGLNMTGDYVLKALVVYGKDVPVSTDPYYVAFRCRYASTETCNMVYFANQNYTPMGGMKWPASAGPLRIYYDSNIGTYITSGSIILYPNVTYRIEVKYKPSYSLPYDGIFQVKVNGIMDIDLTGIRTAGNNSPWNIKRIYLGGSIWVTQYIDDFVIDDAEWIGNSRIQLLQMSGAGSQTDFTASAGSNYQCIDERTADTSVMESDYVYSNVTGACDLYTANDLAEGTNPIQSVKSVQLAARVMLVDIPQVPCMQFAVKSGGTTYYKAQTQDMIDLTSRRVPDTSASQPHFLCMYGEDPAGGSWSVSGVNAAEWGIRANPTPCGDD